MFIKIKLDHRYILIRRDLIKNVMVDSYANESATFFKLIFEFIDGSENIEAAPKGGFNEAEIQSILSELTRS